MYLYNKMYKSLFFQYGNKNTNINISTFSKNFQNKNGNT